MKRFKFQQACLALVMLIMSGILITGCGSNGQTGHWLAPDAAPTVTAVVPLDLAANMLTSTIVTATFSKDMLASTITATGTFTLRDTTTSTDVSGAVTYDSPTMMATFTPASSLTAGDHYRATISIAATDLVGKPLAVNKIWTFTTASTIPTMNSISPMVNDTGVCVNKLITATFSKDMLASTITATGTFTVFDTTANVDVGGLVTYDSPTTTATFTPSANLTDGDVYTATITTAATDLVGNHLTAPNVWSFTAGPATCAAIINPGILGPFGIASYGGVTNAGATKLNGNAVLDPNQNCNAAAVGSGNDFGANCNSGANKITNNVGDLVITQIYPDTTTADAVMVALLAKWNSITMAGLPGGTLLGCGTIGSGGDAGVGIGCNGNYTLPPGIYISNTSSTIDVTGDLILDGQGDPNAVFVFQVPSAALTATPGSPSAHTRILLINGAKASNVWWEVGSSATIGDYSEFQGNVLASASISMDTGATSCGRLLSGASSGAFTFLGNTVSVPGHPDAPIGCE